MTELRALVAQRSKMTRLSTRAKNRLHSTLHRHHIPLPNGEAFIVDQRQWWHNLPISKLEQARVASDWETLAFAQGQIERIEDSLADFAARDEQVLDLL